jgi:5'-AMP-activated protein kinase catalytic alpha subunit
MISDIQILPHLGEGSFGKVKLATHIHTGQFVALKIVDKSGIEGINDMERVCSF